MNFGSIDGGVDPILASLMERLHRAGLVERASLSSNVYDFSFTERGREVFGVLRDLNASLAGGVSHEEAVHLFSLAFLTSPGGGAERFPDDFPDGN